MKAAYTAEKIYKFHFDFFDSPFIDIFRLAIVSPRLIPPNLLPHDLLQHNWRLL